MGRSKATGEWCTPTRELGGSQLLHLVNESRKREAAVEMIHDMPTRKFPAVALEILACTGDDSDLVETRSPGDSPAQPLAQQPPPPDPDPAELEIPMPPAAVPAQRIAPRPRQVRKRSLGGLVFLCVDVLVFLCLGSLSLLGAGV